ncbi:hypothetical protein V9K67_21670 [Paraflavisolibacter sp. H34]|uniref:hypothetical protein n=1 Tax=Huijunlia imazamoxiresistens TaxID=3127457 RepID=UPI003016979A
MPPLSSFFNFWDNFAGQWLQQGPGCIPSSFTPSFSWPGAQILNSKDPSDLSSLYLPEPYWGWTPHSSLPLEMVVMNYNPGAGLPAQHIQQAGPALRQRS